MISNQVGTPVRGKNFYGREAFVRLVGEKLVAGHVLLAAPRRFGKTSVMYSLIDNPPWDYKIVHADLEHFTEPSELIIRLIEQLAKDSAFAKCLSGLSYMPKVLWSSFRDNVEEVELWKAKLKLKDKLRSHWKEKGDELFRQIARTPKTIVFILDEFPMMIDRMARSKVHRAEAKIMLNWLRSLRQNPDNNTRFLIAGSIGIEQVLNQLGEIRAINDFEKMTLEPFPPKTAATFIDKLTAAKKLKISAQSKKKMLDVIGTFVPYFLQIIFSEVAKAYALDGERITPKRVEQIYREKVLGVDCKTYFEHYYGRLRDYYDSQEEKAAKRILREMATVGSLTRDACFQFYRENVGRRVDIEDGFSRLMTNLENDFYISFVLDTRRYNFACKVLRDWWLRHYGMESST